MIFIYLFSLFQLMEYRDAPPSPSTSSVTSVSASGLDALSSPTTPASPVPEEMDDERLPNELLEEICEDMGIKDSMDIDLIDYMMDQTSQMNNTQANENYCNSVDLSHQMHRTPDMGMGMKGPVMPNLSMPMGKENIQHMSSPHYPLMNNVSSSLPRHMSGKPMHHGKSSQSYVGKAISAPLHMQSEQGFKAPCAPTQLTSSIPPNSTNKHSNYHPMPQSQQQTASTNCMHSSYMSSSMTHSCCGGSHQHHPHCSTPSSGENSSFHTRTVTFAEGPPKIMNHNPTSSKYNMAGIGSSNDVHHHNSNNSNNNCPQSQNHGHAPGKPEMYRQHNSAYALQPQNKYGRPSPPVVNVQNMQHYMKMSNNHHNFNNTAKLSHADCLHQPMRPMSNCSFKYEDQQLAALQKGNNGRTLESPLDQGYFSGDAASVKSYSSQSSVCQSNDMLSSQDSLTIKTEPSQQQHHHPQQMMYNRSDMAGQSVVKTENMMLPGAAAAMNQNQREHISNLKQYSSQQQANAYASCNKQSSHQGCIQQYGFNMSTNMTTCSSDPSQKSVQSKILPRLNHSKDVAPYTVPSNNGQATINPYHEFSQGVPTSDQSGLDNNNAAVDFPTNFGKESLNSEHNQNLCQRVGNYGNSDYTGQPNGSCIMANSDFPSPHSHSSSIPPQPSPNTSFTNYRPQSSEMGQAMQQTMAHLGPAYQGACLPKGLEGNQHLQHNTEHVGGYPGMPNQLAPVMKPFKQDPDSQGYSAQKQPYMHDAHMTPQNQLPAQSWSQQQQQQQQLHQQQGYPPMNMNSSIQMHHSNARYMCPRNAVRPPSQCVQSSVAPHSISNPNMSHMEIRNRVGMDLPSNHLGPHHHPNMLNGNIPPQACPQGNWPVDMGRGANVNHQVPQPVNSMQPVQMVPQAKIPNAGLQHMQFPPHSGDPNCPMGVSTNCKFSHRPPMLSSQEAFIEHLIMDKSSAYRSHPLFPLLRDLMITYMNFNSQSIHYQLIQHLPSQFERLLQNFLNRNPPRGDYQSNYAVESVIMDALRYAHSSLIGKFSEILILYLDSMSDIFTGEIIYSFLFISLFIYYYIL